jgi:hypothetical protein
MRGTQSDVKLVTMLLNRLERISADSIWAHRASGIRGSLLRQLDQLQAGKEGDSRAVQTLVDTALHILRQAAKRKG